MTPERYQQISEIYHQALEQPGAARDSFIRRACQNDSELWRHVRALLVAHEQADGFLDQPAWSPPAAGLLHAPGEQIGVWRILSHLGTGGMGEIYLAQDEQLGRRVALKFLPGDVTSDPDRLRRFRQEARAASALNHPNIITVFSVNEAGGAHFIVTEYVEGENLRQRLTRAALPIHETVDIAIQIAGALAAAHEAGIVHRDIKPENVMLRRDGYVKVLDFGLAKLTESADNGGSPGQSTVFQTTPGMMLGTVGYMSPEQARGEEVDRRSDIFSFGVLLYEMLTRLRPFEGNSAAETIAAILYQDPLPAHRLAADVPPKLEQLVTRALAKSRDARWQDARDLLPVLESQKLQLDIEARDAEADYTTARFEAVQKTPVPAGPNFETRMDPAGNFPTPTSSSPAFRELLEPPGGAVPLDSRFYITRPTDEKFTAAITRGDSIVLVKGARQVGKTSLLARGLQQARQAGARVVLTDFQSLSAAPLATLDNLLQTLAGAFADQLDLDVFPDEVWKPNRSPGVNFEQYLRREVLQKRDTPVVWGLDEVDRLFTCDYGSEVFGLFRSWHNRRALDPQGPWRRLTLAIAYATEAHLFITDLNQSPFNVGTRLQIEDFTFEQLEELNQRYGQPLADRAEVARYFRLVGGHPYLVRRGLHEMVTGPMALAALESQADHDEGPFGDHLHRLLISLQKDDELCEVVRGMLQGKPCTSPESFYRLRSAGLAIGESTRDVRPRCQLYATYLERHLL
ncbi:MAG: AAA-like domain-containing protein [Blastocatellia bacterium]